MNSVFLDDLADKVHRGQKGQALKGFWCGGRPYGYALVEVRDPNAPQRYGREGRIGTKLEVNAKQAEVVRRIFESYAAGDSCLTIARALNEASIPSPGSSWKRVKRRCSGWMTSSVRVILRNRLYTGLIRWNANKIPQDPDTGKHVRRARPEKEWVTFFDKNLCIVPTPFWEQCARRSRKLQDGDVRLKAGGKAKYRLSGLLVCGECRAHFVLHSASKYACSSVINGAACSNASRISRQALEAAITDPIDAQLGDPARVAWMAREMEMMWTKHIAAQDARAKTAPREIQELDNRIERLRTRLVAGDPELTKEDLTAVIERLEDNRRQLLSQTVTGNLRASCRYCRKRQSCTGSRSRAAWTAIRALRRRHASSCAIYSARFH